MTEQLCGLNQIVLFKKLSSLTLPESVSQGSSFDVVKMSIRTARLQDEIEPDGFKV